MLCADYCIVRDAVRRGSHKAIAATAHSDRLISYPTQLRLRMSEADIRDDTAKWLEPAVFSETDVIFTRFDQHPTAHSTQPCPLTAFIPRT